MPGLPIGIAGFAADPHVHSLAAAIGQRGAEPVVLEPLPWGRWAWRDGRWFHRHRTIDHLRAAFRRHGYVAGLDVVDRGAVAAGAADWLYEIARFQNQRAMIEAFWRDLADRGAFLVNPLGSGHPAKHVQAGWARAAGLTVPSMLVTTSPGEALAELADGRERIVKPPAGGTLVRRADDEVRRLLPALDLPIALQELVPGDDVRMYVIRGEIVAAGRIRSERLDYRRDADYAATIAPFDVDRPTRDAIARFFERSGLLAASLDFRLRPDGALVFLEANSGGSFAELERALGVPIADRLAEILVEGARAAPFEEPGPPERLPVATTIATEELPPGSSRRLFPFDDGLAAIEGAVASFVPPADSVEIELDEEQRALLRARTGIDARRARVDLRTHRLEPLPESPDGD